MKKQFNHVIDLNGKDKVYPIDKNLFALFFTKDRRFFIYALYTKKDFSSPELIEIDFDTYMQIRDFGIVENFMSSIEEVMETLINIKREAIVNDLTVGEILNIAEKIDDK